MIILKQYTNHQIHIDILPTEKFKTTMITFKFMAPLDYETITARSLLSKVLVRATKKWPTDKSFNKQLSELYGAYINSFVSKFKDKHVIIYHRFICIIQTFICNTRNIFYLTYS